MADHVLQQSRPGFLDKLEINPADAAEEFSRFAYKVMQILPPHIIRPLSREEQHDIIQEIIIHCLDRNLRVLKSYCDQGLPFTKWFLTVAYKKAYDILRQRSKYIARNPSMEDGEMHFDPPTKTDDGPLRRTIAGQLLERVGRILGTMKKKCQILIKAAAEGYTMAEMAVMIGLSSTENKKVSNDLRACRQRLIQLWERAGYSLSEILSS